MNTRMFCSIAAPILLGACATGGASAPKALEVDTAAPMQFKAFFAPRCPVSQETSESLFGSVALAVASQVAGKLAGSAVDALGNYLSKEQAMPFSDTTRMDGFGASQKGRLVAHTAEGCMIVLAARDFKRNLSDDELNRLNPFPMNSSRSDVSVNTDLNKRTGLAGPALFYAEFTMRFNSQESQSAFTLVPRTWYYPKFISPDSWRFSPKRDVDFRIEYSEPGESARFAEFVMTWKAVGAGDIPQAAVLEKKLPWAPLPDGLATAASKINQDEKVPVLPVNVKIMLLETAQPYTILKYAGEAMKSQGEVVSSAAEEKVKLAFSQQARAAARSAAATDVGKKLTAYSEAYAAAEEAQKKYASASAGAPAARQKALVDAKLAYVQLASAQVAVQASYSALEIGGFQPFPDLPALP